MLLAISRGAWAQAYPLRPVWMIVPFAPAGTSDIVARLIAQWLSEHLGQQFIVENRPGGAGNIGTEAVVRAPPDGYMLLVGNVADVINGTLFEKLSFNFIRDIVPVANMVRVANVRSSSTMMATRAREIIAGRGYFSVADSTGAGPHAALAAAAAAAKAAAAAATASKVAPAVACLGKLLADLCSSGDFLVEDVERP